MLMFESSLDVRVLHETLPKFDLISGTHLLTVNHENRHKNLYRLLFNRWFCSNMTHSSEIIKEFPLQNEGHYLAFLPQSDIKLSN